MLPYPVTSVPARFQFSNPDAPAGATEQTDSGIALQLWERERRGRGGRERERERDDSNGFKRNVSRHPYPVQLRARE